MCVGRQTNNVTFDAELGDGGETTVNGEKQSLLLD